MENSELKIVIDDAFPSLSARPDLTPLCHEDAVWMRSRLPMLRAEDMPFYLPQILNDLAFTHTNVPGQSEEAEAVVQYLNVLNQGGSYICGPEENTEVIMERKEAFRLLDSRQAFAVAIWLEEAHAWADLEWYKDEIKSALNYWKERAI